MYVSPQNSGQPGCFVCQMVGSHVHLFLADWRREQLQNGESVVVQQRPCSLWGSLRGGRVQGSCTKGRPSGPSLLTFPRNVMTTFLCTNSGSGRSQIWWQVPLIVFTSLYFWHAPSVSLPRVFDAQWSTFSTPTYTYKLMCKRPPTCITWHLKVFISLLFQLTFIIFACYSLDFPYPCFSSRKFLFTKYSLITITL